MFGYCCGELLPCLGFCAPARKILFTSLCGAPTHLNVACGLDIQGGLLKQNFELFQFFAGHRIDSKLLCAPAFISEMPKTPDNHSI